MCVRVRVCVCVCAGVRAYLCFLLNDDNDESVRKRIYIS